MNRAQAADADVPLFADRELIELAEPLAKSLAAASPSDDVAFVSSARRGDVSFLVPVAVTARLFVQSGALQLILRDARFDFFNHARGMNTRPVFEFGTRAKPGSAVLQSTAAATKRSDWLEMPLAMPTAVQPATAVVLPSGAMPAAAVAPAGGAPTAAAPAAPRVRDAAFADEIEHRLVILKRMRDRGLISEEEYQHKRKEILSLLCCFSRRGVEISRRGSRLRVMPASSQTRQHREPAIQNSKSWTP